jgi:hypothetical protein
MMVGHTNIYSFHLPVVCRHRCPHARLVNHWCTAHGSTRHGCKTPPRRCQPLPIERESWRRFSTRPKSSGSTHILWAFLFDLYSCATSYTVRPNQEEEVRRTRSRRRALTSESALTNRDKTRETSRSHRATPRPDVRREWWEREGEVYVSVSVVYREQGHISNK